MGEQQQQQQQGEAQAQPEVLPAVTIMGIDVNCTETVVFFPTDSAELTNDERAILDNLAACLKGTPEKEKLEITGRADPRGPEPYNEKLSRERAQAVADYLQKQGVKAESFEIRARGEKGAVEGIPPLWPLQRHTTVESKEPVMP
jgi:outer membrane protein OmpA-like peptidoglycan-associated protein